jgi:cytochrome P450
MVVLVADHDTLSVLMTFMIRHLVGDPATLATMVQGNHQKRTHSYLFYGL